MLSELLDRVEEQMSKIDKLRKLIFNYMNRNKIIFCEQTRYTIRNEVNLHWYSTKSNDGIENLGDYLSVVVVKNLLIERNILEHKKLYDTKHLYAIGSIIFYGFQRATIWGSGLLHKAPFYRMPFIYHLDIRAVRGPLTRKSLMKNGFKVPEVYGDPAILLPLFYTPLEQVSDQREYIVIKHKNSTEIVEDGSTVNILTNNWMKTVDEIASAKLVLSGSLHGIIIAEAYGVPAILVKSLMDPADKDLFKYKDWYYSTGRKDFPMAEDIETALKMEGVPGNAVSGIWTVREHHFPFPFLPLYSLKNSSCSSSSLFRSPVVWAATQQ